MLRLLVTAGLLASTTSASADVGALTSDSFPYRRGRGVDVDAGLVVGFPTALPTGLSRGIGGGYTGTAEPFRWGLRAAWLTATESTADWSVTQSDLRLRATTAIQHDAGRGSIALRLGVGGTLVHESRERKQGMRAGLMGSDLSTSAFAFAPAADIEAVVTVHVAGAWLLVVSGGPSGAIVDYAVHGSWVAELGVGWQP